MNDETRKALDKIFSSGNHARNLTAVGASKVVLIEDVPTFSGRFEIRGSTLNELRQLYDDAIAADDAAKFGAQREADINAEHDKKASEKLDADSGAQGG